MITRYMAIATLVSLAMPSNLMDAQRSTEEDGRAESLQTQVADSCLTIFRLHPPDGPPEYIDSVMVDTCQSSPTFNRLFAKFEFVIRLSNGIGLVDTIGEFRWWDVPNDKFGEGVREGLKRLEEVYGPLLMRNAPYLFCDTTRGRHDTRFIAWWQVNGPRTRTTNIWWLKFERFVPVDIVVDSMHSLLGYPALKGTRLMSAEWKGRKISMKEVYSQPQLATLPLDSAVFFLNPDQIKVDTNLLSPTYTERFADRGFLIDFSSHVFSYPPSYTDTASVLRWQDIDSQYTAMRNDFEAFSTTVGSFYFSKRVPDSTWTSVLKTRFYLYFDDYENINEVLDQFNDIQDVECEFGDRSGHLTIVPNDQALVPLTEWRDSDPRITLTDGILLIEWETPGWAETAHTRVYDITGRLVLNSISATPSAHHNNQAIDVSELFPGLYFVVLSDMKAHPIIITH